MYRITVNDTETYLVVMKNVFSPRLNIHKKYDLKVTSFSTFLVFCLSVCLSVSVSLLSHRARVCVCVCLSSL